MALKMVVAVGVSLASLAGSEAAGPRGGQASRGLRRRLAGGAPFVQCMVPPKTSSGIMFYQPNGWTPDSVELLEAGFFTLYDTPDWNTQVRIEHMLPADHTDHDEFFWARAYSTSGAWLCGLKIEATADPQRLVVTDENGTVWTHEGHAAIKSAPIVMNKEGCPKFSAFAPSDKVINFKIDGRDAGFPYVINWQFHDSGLANHASAKGLQMMLQVWDHAENYLDTDTGVCTKRGNYLQKVECADADFTEFPVGTPCGPEPEPTPAATPAPTPAPTSEVTLQPTAHPTEAEPATCGRPGKIGKKAASKERGIKDQLNGSKKAETACICKDACKAIGGTEFMWKPKSGRCRCFTGAAKVTYNSKKNKRIAGLIEGSAAVIVEKM